MLVYIVAFEVYIGNIIGHVCKLSRETRQKFTVAFLKWQKFHGKLMVEDFVMLRK